MRRLFQGLVGIAACLSIVGAAGAAWADDDYPNRPVRFLVGYPPAGTVDICARLIGQYLSEHLHHKFAIENKPGPGNNLATEIARTRRRMATHCSWPIRPTRSTQRFTKI